MIIRTYKKSDFASSKTSYELRECPFVADSFEKLPSGSVR